MFINYTNHPSASWGEKQTKEAKKYGEIRDVLFPNISPQMTVQELTELVKTESKKIVSVVESEKDSAVLCQGESVFTYMLVNSLLGRKLGAHRWQSGLRNLKVLSAVSERKVVEIVDGDVTQKKSEFFFEGFREYTNGRNVVDTTNLQPSLYEKNFQNSKLENGDKILITQLGKGGYLNTNYVNKDGKPIASTGYAFDAVVKETNPNKLLLIGTKTSGWSEVLEWYSLHLSEEKKAEADRLGKQIADQKGENIDWKLVEEFIRKEAHFEQVRIAIVEPGSTQEQLEEYPKRLLNAFKDVVDKKKNTKIIFDISNGFRSMPLYITMFVRYAGMINRSEIKYSMYYGMFEARKGSNTPLVDLSAVSELTDWVNAISEFQSLGSVKGLCECLNREVGKQSDKVKQDQIKYVIRQFEQFDCAWNVNNLYYLENGIKQISTKDLPVSETAKLMLNSLRDEFSRRFKKKEKYNYSWLLISLSELFTEQGRYGVAAVALQEGFVTYIMERYVKKKILQQLRLSSEKYEKECIHNYYRRTLVKNYWEMKMETHKKKCGLEEIDKFWENYLTIKRKIRNVESHIVYIEEELPESEEIEKWLKSAQGIIEKDLNSKEGIGFEEIFSDFVLKDIVESRKFFRGEENGKWNLLDKKCLERGKGEKEKKIKTTLENANISLEKVQELQKQLLFVQKKCDEGSDLSLADLKSASMVESLIKQWITSDFLAKKMNQEVSEGDLIRYMKTGTNAKGIRKTGFERLESVLRNNLTDLLFDVLTN